MVPPRAGRSTPATEADGPPPTELAATLHARVVAAYRGARDPERARAMAAYMRDQFPFVGIASPERVALNRAAVDGLPAPAAADLESVARLLWDEPERELQYFATWYLRRHAAALDDSSVDLLQHLIVTKPWWDTIDELAQHAVGPLVLRHRPLVAVMDEWIEDDDFWLARTAILHQNRYRGDTDAERLFRYCARRAADREFFIRKAIGWALREYTRVDPDAVRAFVTDHADVLSGLSRREALKWLDRRATRPRS